MTFSRPTEQLQSALARAPPSPLPGRAPLSAGSKTLNQSQLDNTLRELAQFSHKIPMLPDEAFSRESLYIGIMTDAEWRRVRFCPMN
jgi:hypothetical protein